VITIVASKKNKKNTLMEQMRVLSDIRTSLMNDEIAKSICEENDMGGWFLKSVPISFDKIKVAAKTINGKIILNPKLIKKPFKIIMRYVIHELVHAIQHVEDFGKNQDDKDDDYLDRNDEIEAFQRQIEYDSKTRGPDEAEKYVDNLLEYHDIPKSKVEEKKSEFMERV
jgi:hypothetical protein